MARPFPGRPSTDRWRTLVLPALVAILVAGAGCSGLVGSDDPSAGETTTVPEPTETEAPEPTTTTTDAPTETEIVASGQMKVLVGDELVEDTADTASFEYDSSARQTWNATANTTLAEALASLDVDASQDSLTYEGETYRDSSNETSSNGTTVIYRVNGDSVNPTEYTLEDGDEVWVIVETQDMERSVPGEYLEEEDLHIHGSLEMVVDGQQVNFSQEEYVHSDDYFHFHEGESSTWHGHSHSVTLEYALSTFPGVEVTDDGVTFEDTTYESTDPDTSVRFEVNGDPVTPSEYYLKDGDDIRVEITTET